MALLLIDCSVEHGALTYAELIQHTKMKYGTIQRSMAKLLTRGVYAGARDGLQKRFTLCDDWLPEVEVQLPTMRTCGLKQKREIADAAAVYNYCSALLKTTSVEQQPKLKRRQERAFNRLMAAVAVDAPALATNTNFGASMRSACQHRHHKAPEMPEPGALAWYRLTELTGKEWLTADEFGELQALDRVLGAGVGTSYGQVAYA